jgi:hypothetical protein
MLYWENSHIFRGILYQALLKLNNLTGQKFGMSELKLSWPVTLTGKPPAMISRPDWSRFYCIIFRRSCTYWECQDPVEDAQTCRKSSPQVL